MTRLRQYVSRLSVLQDDRGAVIYAGGTASLNADRASLILNAQPGSLEPVDDKQKPAKQAGDPPPPQLTTGTPDGDGGGAEQPSGQALPVEPLRAAVSNLHHTRRRALARRLGGEDDVTTEGADALIAATADDDLTEAAAEFLEG